LIIGVVGLELNAIAYFVDGNNQIYTPIVNAFNEYAEMEELDIHVNLNFFSPQNSTVESEDFEATVESLLKKPGEKYDIYFYDSLYTQIYAPYLYNLRELLPDDYIDIYDSNILSETCKYNDAIVGLVNFNYTFIKI